MIKQIVLMVFPVLLLALEKDAISIPSGPVLERTYSSSRGVLDTLGYPGQYGGQFIMSPGDAMLMVYQTPGDGILKGVNIPIYEWGTGDQELTISIHKLAYPNGADGTPYSLETVDGNGWIGGYLTPDPKDSLCLSISGTEYVSDWEGIADNARDPLLAEEPHTAPPGIPPQGYIWPWATAAKMDTVTFGDFVNDGEIDHWISTEAFGEDPKFKKDEWIGLLVQFTGAGGGEDEATGFFYTEGAGVVDPWRFLKFYGGCASGTSGGGGWHIRHWVVLSEFAVEFTGDRGPVIHAVSPLSTTVSISPRDVWAVVTDDNPSGGPSGIDYVNLKYSLDDSIYHEVNMVNAGLDTFYASLPGQDPGAMILWYIEAADVMGNITSNISRVYSIYKPRHPNLFFYNSSDYGPDIWRYYLYGADIEVDFWDGSNYGSNTLELFQVYKLIIEVTGSGPLVNNNSIMTQYLSSGMGDYILTGDEWLGAQASWKDTTFTSGDFHYEYLGIKAGHKNINYLKPGDENGISRIIPVENDDISGYIYDYLGDSLQLNYDPNYELGNKNGLDGIDPVPGTNVAFYGVSGILDEFGEPTGSDTVPTGIYRVHESGSRIVFYTFDPLGVEIYPDPHPWVTFGIENPLIDAIRWVKEDNVSIGKDIPTPKQFSLHQNHPNPFNPVTTIRYELPKFSHVRLSIYDILGREVAVIRDGDQGPGVKEVQWDASQVPSGIYFIQMQAGDFRQVRKVMVLK